MKRVGTAAHVLQPENTMTTFSTFKRGIWALACLAALASATQAQEVNTLKKIKDSNTITLGHRESSIPFSYYDDRMDGDRQAVIGYSQAVMIKAVEAVKATLHADKLVVKMMPVTSSNRITLLQNGTVDIECGSTTNNAERQKQVGFSNTIFVVGTRLLVKKGSGIHDFADLAGKNVVVTAGTTSERLLRKMNEDKQLKMNIVSAKDHGESFLMLETGRSSAFMMDDALLYGEMAKARKPADWEVVGTAQSHEAYGCMLPKGDAAFKKVVDGAIAKVFTSGEGEKIYKQWFQSPIPPKGLNLNMALSPDMKTLFKTPNDKSFD